MSKMTERILQNRIKSLEKEIERLKEKELITIRTVSMLPKESSPGYNAGIKECIRTMENVMGIEKKDYEIKYVGGEENK